MGSVSNCRKEIPTRHAIRWFKCELKPPKKPSEAPAYKAKLSLNKAAYAKLSIFFKTTHALNVKTRPAKDYIWMNELHKSNGLDVGDHYSMNVNNCTELQHHTRQSDKK